MTIEKINAAIQKVKQMKYTPAGSDSTNSSVTRTKAILDEAKRKIAEINTDEMLSAQGREQKAREVKKQTAVEIAKLVREFEAEKKRELDAAERMAVEIITKPASKPEQSEIDLFNREYNDLKTELTVFGNSYAAQKMLDFMAKEERPYFAERIRNDFAEFGGKLTGSIDSSKVRIAYENLKRSADTSEKAIAEQKLAEIQQFKKGLAVDTMTIGIGIRSVLGDEYVRAIEDHEGYLRAVGQ